MPLKVPAGLPALQRVIDEGNSVELLHAATPQTLRIALLNIMPMKETTEADFIRLLATSSNEIELTLLKLDTHTPKHASPEHMERYYTSFNHVRGKHFDGLIITGAPIEKIEYEEVTYWPELCGIFDWAKSNVTSTLFICWAAQAGLYQKFGIQKHLLPEKMFGIFPHSIAQPDHPLFTGFDSTIYVPHSRHTEIRREDVIAEERIELLSESKQSGVYIMQQRGTKNFFITGHSEYALYTLDGEYKRDVAKGLPIGLPQNYYRDNNPANEPVNLWQDTARKLFGNWIEHYCKQN
ncbi:MAG: homoserine O-succinyltransferase [Bacteroidaceae bacterium]|nr:homoserine O-succinyltransferase [Bacteroidaceae bacterium]